jgi:hypothetical protein
MGKKTVRLRRATIDDFGFCKMLYEDISNEILYGNNKAFGISEAVDDKETEVVEIEFEAQKLLEDWYKKAITVWKHKIYIIEFVSQDEIIPIGYFQVAKTGKGEPNRIRSWSMIPDYFDLKEEALKTLLSRKELINKKVTINILDTDCAFNWLIEKFGFKEDDTVLSSLSLN